MITETNIADKEIIITRTLNAPRKLVWEAWTKPEHVKIWWGPNGFTNTFHGFDLKEGGVWKFIMHGPDGTDYPNKIIFTKIEKPVRLEYKHVDDRTDETHFEVIVLFEEAGDKTTLSMRSIFKTKEARDFAVEKFGAIEGGHQTLSRLEEYLAQNL